MPGDPSSPQPSGRDTTPRLNELIGLGPIDARNGRATCEVHPTAGAAGVTTTSPSPPNAHDPNPTISDPYRSIVGHTPVRLSSSNRARSALATVNSR